MRLNDKEIEAIKKAFKETFKNGKIYLFGSRLDDEKRGGDIDLFIESNDEELFEKKIDFLVKLKQMIGDQKIDVVISKDKSRFIEKEALKNGVEL